MGGEVKWIKIVTNIFDDEKIRFIEKTPNGDETIVIWFRILCLAGKSNSQGMLMLTERVPYTEEMLSAIFDRDIMAVKTALALFSQLEMIEIVDNRIMISNWEKHQNVDKLEQLRNANAKRVANYRAKQLPEKAEPAKGEIKPDVEQKPRKAFIPPTVEQVELYVKTAGLDVNAKAFVSFYESKEWMVGKNKMVNWQAGCRTWHTLQYGKLKKTGRSEPIPDYGPKTEPLSEEEIENLKARFSRIGKEGK